MPSRLVGLSKNPNFHLMKTGVLLQVVPAPPPFCRLASFCYAGLPAGFCLDSHLSSPGIASGIKPPPRNGRADHAFLHGVAPDRVYIVKPVLPQAGWALTPPFHPYALLTRNAVSLCCTCPEITLGGRYPLSLPYGARTFLIRCLSACVRGCPTRSPQYCTPRKANCQMSCKFFSEGIY